MTTIKEVAQKAGVSKSTVSRVLNDGYVDAQTRQRVEETIKELKYTPNALASGIRTGKSRMIAVMIPDSSNAFYIQMFKEIERSAIQRGYMVLLCDTNRSVENEISFTEHLLGRSIDGLLYFAQEKLERNERYFCNLSKTLPVVFMDQIFAENKEISFVAIDGTRGMSDVVDLLVSKGRRHLAFINLPSLHNIDKPRFDSYCAALQRHALAFDADLVIHRDADAQAELIDEGYIATRLLCAKKKPIDAIITPADQLAVGVIKYLKEAGIHVPQQICVTGFDDIHLCTVVEPSITTVRQPIQQMAQTATTLLLDKIEEKPITRDRIAFRGEIIEREST